MNQALKPQLSGRCAPRLTVKPFKQKDGFNCGVYALQALHGYYGLKSHARDLKVRLGTEFTTPVFLPGRKALERQLEERGWDNKGTWPWDVFIALAQDGFQVKPLGGLLSKDALPVLNQEIKNRYPVLLLELSPCPHYNVLCGVSRKGAWIACSLGPRVYFKPWCAFDDRVTGMVAVRPTNSVQIGKKAAFRGEVVPGRPTKSIAALTSATTWIGKLSYRYSETTRLGKLCYRYLRRDHK